MKNPTFNIKKSQISAEIYAKLSKLPFLSSSPSKHDSQHSHNTSHHANTQKTQSEQIGPSSPYKSNQIGRKKRPISGMMNKPVAIKSLRGNEAAMLKSSSPMRSSDILPTLSQPPSHDNSPTADNDVLKQSDKNIRNDGDNFSKLQGQINSVSKFNHNVLESLQDSSQRLKVQTLKKRGINNMLNLNMTRSQNVTLKNFHAPNLSKSDVHHTQTNFVTEGSHLKDGSEKNMKTLQSESLNRSRVANKEGSTRVFDCLNKELKECIGLNEDKGKKFEFEGPGQMNKQFKIASSSSKGFEQRPPKPTDCETQDKTPSPTKGAFTGYKVQWFNNSLAPIEKYIGLGKTLGQGAFAKVYEAFDRSLGGRVVAVKLFDKRVLTSSSARKSLQNEIDLLSTLSHPNIVKLLRVAEDQRYVCLVLEHLGETTLKMWSEKQKFGRPMLRVLFQIAEALAYLHGQGVYHRDLKHNNIMVKDGKATLLDFGMAVQSHQEKEYQYCGTATYLSPEMVNRGSYYPAPNDVWAFGVVVYRCVMGKYPFGSKFPFLSRPKNRQGHEHEYPQRKVREDWHPPYSCTLLQQGFRAKSSQAYNDARNRSLEFLEI